MKRCLACLVIFIGVTWLVVSSVIAETRQWTSNDGKFQVIAEVIGVTNSKVRLRTESGSTVVVQTSRLSAEDQAYLNSIDPTSQLRDDSKLPVLMSNKDALASLTAKGLKVSKTGLTLENDTKMASMLKSVDQSSRRLQTVSRKVSTLEKQSQAIEAEITRLRQTNVQLNTQLARVNAGNGRVRLNNTLIGAIKANEGRIALRNGQQQNIQNLIRQIRTTVNQNLEKHTGRLLEARKWADSMNTRYAELAADTDVLSALETLNQNAKRPLKIAPSRSFMTTLRRLQDLENTVLTENIPLDIRQGGTMYVSVVINGDHPQKMVLDSGASFISLPHSVAEQCGIEVDASAPRIRLTLADNRVIPGRLVTIPQVRVGKFVVDNVECAVLGPEAVNATPLLGMSFLGNFKFEVDASSQSLRMVKIAAE